MCVMHKRLRYIYKMGSGRLLAARSHFKTPGDYSSLIMILRVDFAAP